MKADGFVAAGPAVNLKPHARRAFIAAYERRLDQEVTHPLFGYRVSMRRLLEVQARLLGAPSRRRDRRISALSACGDSPMVEERLYIVAYDITDDRRWRRVFKLMPAMAAGCSSRCSSAGYRAAARRDGAPARATDPRRDDQCSSSTSGLPTKSTTGGKPRQDLRSR